jgi:hypothetical protein
LRFEPDRADHECSQSGQKNSASPNFSNVLIVFFEEQRGQDGSSDEVELRRGGIAGKYAVSAVGCH